MKRYLILLSVCVIAFSIPYGCEQNSYSRSGEQQSRVGGREIQNWGKSAIEAQQEASYELLETLVMPSREALMSHARRMTNTSITSKDLSTYTLWGFVDLPPGGFGGFGGCKPLWDAKTNKQYTGMFWDVYWIPDPKLIQIDPSKYWDQQKADSRISRTEREGLGVNTKVLLVYSMEYGKPKFEKAFISDPLEGNSVSGGDINSDTGHADYAIEMMNLFSAKIPTLSKINAGKMYGSRRYSLLPDSMNFYKDELEDYFRK